MSTSTIQRHLLQKIEDGLKDQNIPKYPVTLYDPYRYALQVGGKRIRPLLTLLGCGLCNGDADDAFSAALAVEILHNFTLVHDDIMDSADTRRGEPSVFKKWNKNIAILSGDVIFAEACRKIAWYGSNDEYTKQEFAAMHKIFLEAVITICEGQALDMEFVSRETVSHEEYIEMISGKTAALLGGALEMGAIAAHASSEEREKLYQLGIEMGIAFQIQDDLLDAVADPEKFGKRPGGDIFEGKKTYLTILALERAQQEQATLINNVLNSENPQRKEVEKVLEIMKDLKVLEDVASEVSEHYQKALDVAGNFSESKYKQELENLLIFLKNRDH